MSVIDRQKPTLAEKEIERIVRENHFVAIAEETLLRIEDGKFVHTSLPSIKRAIMTKVADGSDPRLIKFQENSYVGQIVTAGHHITDLGKFPDRNMPVSQMVKDERRFSQMVGYTDWKKFFLDIAEKFPEDTTFYGVAWLLIHAKDLVQFKSVKERIAQRKNQFPLPTDH